MVFSGRRSAALSGSSRQRRSRRPAAEEVIETADAQAIVPDYRSFVAAGEAQTLRPLNELKLLVVSTCANALIRRAIAADPDIGRQTSTINPVVLECNDGYLNDIQAMAVTEAHADAAIAAAGGAFAVGAVGAGTGMSCFGLKGGIGSASRRLRLDGATYHLGVLVLANFGRAGDLRLPDGRPDRSGGGGGGPVSSCSAPTFRWSIASLAARETPEV